MALGHGSKKSVSCDQVVIPAPLDNGVSNACTTRIIRYISLTVFGLIYVNLVEVCLCRPGSS